MTKINPIPLNIIPEIYVLMLESDPTFFLHTLSTNPQEKANYVLLPGLQPCKLQNEFNSNKGVSGGVAKWRKEKAEEFTAKHNIKNLVLVLLTEAVKMEQLRKN